MAGAIRRAPNANRYEYIPNTPCQFLGIVIKRRAFGDQRQNLRFTFFSKQHHLSSQQGDILTLVKGDSPTLG
jgi:hypothetical protein